MCRYVKCFACTALGLAAFAGPFWVARWLRRQALAAYWQLAVGWTETQNIRYNFPVTLLVREQGAEATLKCKTPAVHPQT